MGQRRDCKQSIYTSRAPWTWGWQDVCVLCNYGSVQKHSGDDVDSILPTNGCSTSHFFSPRQFPRSPPLFNRNNSSNPQTWTVYQHVQSISADIGLKVFNKSWSEVTLETSSCSEFKFNRSHPSSGPPAHSECCCLHTAEVLSSGTTSPRKSYSRCSTSLAKKGRVKEKKHPSFQSSHTQS